MIDKLTRMFSIVALVMVLSVACTPEGTEYVVGKIERVDQEVGQLELVMENGEVKTFTVPQESLGGVKRGHEVELEIVQDKVIGLENFDASH